jgi:hypothetical protein
VQHGTICKAAVEPMITKIFTDFDFFNRMFTLLHGRGCANLSVIFRDTISNNNNTAGRLLSSLDSLIFSCYNKMYCHLLQDLVSPLLEAIVNSAVEVAESNRGSWDALLATARPATALSMENPDLTDYTLSSETEEGPDMLQSPLVHCNNLQQPESKICLVPYAFKYNDFVHDDDDDTTTTTDGASQDDDENKSVTSLQPRKKRKPDAFSRNAYVKRRKRSLKHQTRPMSSLARQDSSGSGEDPKKKLLDDKLQKNNPAHHHHQLLFVQDEFNPGNDTATTTSGDDQLFNAGTVQAGDPLGKGKRKRFQNVRMVPIEDIVKSPVRSSNKNISK